MTWLFCWMPPWQTPLSGRSLPLGTTRPLSTPQHPEGLPLSSTLADELPPEALRSGVILGGKTGFTSQAGLCLATLSRLGTDEYILITGSAPGNHATEQYNITDACLLLNALSSVLVSG